MADALVAPPPAALPGRLQQARLLVLLLPAALLAAAFASEYVGGLVPCEMCWWQRYAHFAALPPAVAAFAVPPPPARPLVLLAAAAIAVSGAIGLYHAGVELGIFEGLTACAATAGGASQADLLNSILATPVVRCDQVQWSLFGISMAGWNAILSLGGAGAAAALVSRGAR